MTERGRLQSVDGSTGPMRSWEAPFQVKSVYIMKNERRREVPSRHPILHLWSAHLAALVPSSLASLSSSRSAGTKGCLNLSCRCPPEGWDVSRSWSKWPGYCLSFDEAQSLWCLIEQMGCPLVWDAGIQSPGAKRRWWSCLWGTCEHFDSKQEHSTLQQSGPLALLVNYHCKLMLNVCAGVLLRFFLQCVLLCQNMRYISKTSSVCFTPHTNYKLPGK